MPRSPSNVISFEEAEQKRLDAWCESEARKLGYASYQALADDVDEMQAAEAEKDPEFQAWMRESAEHSNRSE